jgi:hypothetical protein
LHHILKTGVVNRGDVPIHPSKGIRAPWFTSNPDWHDQGWVGGSSLDKTGVRMSFEFEDEDPALRRWSDLAKEYGVKDIWYKTLNDIGGGGAEDWWLYMDKSGVQMNFCLNIELRSSSVRLGYSKTQDFKYNSNILSNIQSMLERLYNTSPKGMVSTMSNFGYELDQKEPGIGEIYDAYETENPAVMETLEEMVSHNVLEDTHYPIKKPHQRILKGKSPSAMPQHNMVPQDFRQAVEDWEFNQAAKNQPTILTPGPDRVHIVTDLGVDEH